MDKNIFLYNNYATYFKDLEQTFYFDIVNSNQNYTGLHKIWNRGKINLMKVIEFKNGNPVSVLSGDAYNDIHTNVEILQENLVI